MGHIYCCISSREFNLGSCFTLSHLCQVITNIQHVGLEVLGVVYIMNHKVVPCQRALPMIRFILNGIYSFWALTKCKPNMDQEK